MRRGARFLVIAAGLAACLSAAENGWGFGRNKVRYRSFDWKILHTDHFEIFFYPGEETLAREVAEIAERAWRRQVDYFRLLKMPQRKVPIFLYATFHDFIQTNVTPQPLEEGVGGFTEVFKTRVVLPLGMSPEQRRHVIEHELVHALQFFILYGEGLRSYSLYKSVIVPLWFMEGVAEHVPGRWDAQGEMVLRDAVLSDRLPQISLLHSFNHLEPHDAYLGYKAGHSACDYLAEHFGDDKIPALLKGIEDGKTFAQVFRDKVGITLEEFDRRWRRSLRERYWSWSRGRKDAGEYGAAVIRGRPGVTEHNTAPAASSADDAFAFLSDRRGVRELFVVRKGRRPDAILGSGGVQLLGSTPDWSPDGTRLAVMLAQHGRAVLGLVDPRNGRVRRRYSLPFLDAAHPRFSPDGNFVALAGFDGAETALYLLELGTGSIRRLTHEPGAAGPCAFAPDGRTLVYALEGVDGTELRVLDSWPAAAPVTRPLRAGRPVKGTRPDVSPDGQWVLFDSGHNGAPNLFITTLDGSQIRQVTDARTGIWAGRWARDGRRILAVTLEAGCQNIHVLEESVSRLAPLAMGSEPPPPASTEETPAVPASPLEVPPSRLSPPSPAYTLGFSIASFPPSSREARPAPAAVLVAAPRAAVWRAAFPAASRVSGVFDASGSFAAPRTPGFGALAAGPAWTGGPPAAWAAAGTTLVAATVRPRDRSAPAFRVPRTAAPPVPDSGSAPAAPTPAPLALTATRSGPDIVLSWSSPIPAAAVSRYEIRRSTDPAAPGRLLAVLYDPAATLWRDNTWTYEETYIYRVEARAAADALRAAAELTYRVPVEAWDSDYTLELDSRLVDLFVMVGSITIGAGTSFAGYGALQLSDLPGNHRLAVEANAFPSFSSLYGVSYAYSGWRPDVGISVYSQQTHFIIYPSLVSTENLERPPSLAGADGVSAGLAWPLDVSHRIEIGAGVQRITEVFTDRRGDVILGPKHSLIAPAGVALVRDTSRWRRLLPIGGTQIRAGVTQSVPLSSGVLRFTEYETQLQWYRRLFPDVSLAVRWLGLVSGGRDQRTFYMGGRYYLRAHPFAEERGRAVALGNHELRANLFEHLNWSLPLLPMLFTDVQAVGFFDAGGGFDPSRGIAWSDLRAASVGGGLNLIGFMLQSSPVMFSIEVARRIDTRDPRPTVYGRLGPVF